MGDNEISKARREQLIVSLHDLKDNLTEILESYILSLQSYGNLMNKGLIENLYFSNSDFIKLHRNSKSTTIEQFKSKTGDNEFKDVIQQKIDVDIEQKLTPLEAINEAKKQEFIKRTNLHSETVKNELKASFESKVRAKIGGSFLSDSEFSNLFSSTKQKLLQEFTSRKMSDDELSTQTHYQYRAQLERDIDNMRSTLKAVNNENYRPEPRKPSNWVQFRDSIRRGLGIIK